MTLVNLPIIIVRAMHLCVFREKGDSCVRKSEQFIEFPRIIGGFHSEEHVFS